MGSVVAITDASGTLTSQQRYLPFGQVRTNVTSPNSQALTTDLSYTGQRDLGMGLMDYHARFYSPTLGRFTQPDTLIPGADNPQAWNRFSYVMNSPILYNDPSGHMRLSDEDGDTGLYIDESHNSGNKEEKEEKLTNAELIGQVITLMLIEGLLLVADAVLLNLTVEATVACGGGVLTACVADAGLLAIDIVVADFQFSLAKEIGDNVSTGTKHEFEWTFIPAIIEGLNGE